MELWQRFRFWYNLQPPVFRMLLTINVLVYLFYNWLIQPFAPAVPIGEWFALHVDLGAVATHPWQLVTYSFLHDGFLHMAFNMLWLYWLGKDLEGAHGSTVFAAVYFGGVVGAALLTVALHAAFPTVAWFGGPVVGASGGVLAILAAAATFHPNTSISLFLLGRIPLPMLVVGFLVLDFVITAASGSNTAIGAHWGGALTGFLLARGERTGRNVTSWARFFVPGRSQGGSPARPRSRSDPDEGTLDRIENWLEDRRQRKEGHKATVHEMPRSEKGRRTAPVTSEPDVDKLLDKISEHGYDALTDEEKKILYEASRK